MYVPSMYVLCIFHSVLLLNSNHCIHIPHLVYPFTSCWIPGLFLPFGYCEQCSYESLYTICYVNIFSGFFFHLGVELLGACGTLMYIF